VEQAVEGEGDGGGDPDGQGADQQGPIDDGLPFVKGHELGHQLGPEGEGRAEQHPAHGDEDDQQHRHQGGLGWSGSPGR
jgi:hypothetical protein